MRGNLDGRNYLKGIEITGINLLLTGTVADLDRRDGVPGSLDESLLKLPGRNRKSEDFASPILFREKARRTREVISFDILENDSGGPWKCIQF